MKKKKIVTITIVLILLLTLLLSFNKVGLRNNHQYGDIGGGILFNSNTINFSRNNLSSRNVQDAIDELYQSIFDGCKAGYSKSSNSGGSYTCNKNLDAPNQAIILNSNIVKYNNTNSSLLSTDVSNAIGEIADLIPNCKNEYIDTIINTTSYNCKKTITITANNQSINYGDNILNNSNQVTVTGLLNNNTINSITLTPSTTSVTNDGLITPSNVVIYDNNNNDITNTYNINYVTGSLVISSVPYTVNYYNGDGSDTDGATLLDSQTCYYGLSCTLETYATDLNALFPFSEAANQALGTTNLRWYFYGWTNSTSSTTKIYDDGETIELDSYTDTLNLYSLGKKTYYFNSGVAPTDILASEVQYWNPYSKDEGNRTSINIPTPTQITSWTFVGYIGGNNTATNNTVHFASSLAGTEYNPIIETGATGWMRSKYSRTLTVNYNGNGNTGGSTAATTLVQYYNSGIANISTNTNSGATLGSNAITLRTNGFTRTNYTFSKWAEGSASGTQYAAGASYTGIGTSVTNTTVSKTMYAVWLNAYYDITFNFHEGDTYTNDEYLNTGYKINWDRNFVITVKFKYSTQGVRHLVIGSYNDSGKTLNIEISTANKLRLYMGSGAVDRASSVTLPTGTTITAVFTWTASSDSYSLTATADGMSNISITGTQSMSGTASNALWTNRDHRGTGTFTQLQIVSPGVTIKDTRATNSTLSDLPSFSKSGRTNKGWYTESSGGTKISTSTKVTGNATYHLQWKKWTKVTYNCTTGTWSTSPTTSYEQTCTKRTKAQANAGNYSTYTECDSMTPSACGSGAYNCYYKKVYSRTGCSTYSSSGTTETGQYECSASTGSLYKITCTEES